MDALRFLFLFFLGSSLTRAHATIDTFQFHIHCVWHLHNVINQLAIFSSSIRIQMREEYFVCAPKHTFRQTLGVERKCQFMTSRLIFLTLSVLDTCTLISIFVLSHSQFVMHEKYKYGTYFVVIMLGGSVEGANGDNAKI